MTSTADLSPLITGLIPPHPTQTLIPISDCTLDTCSISRTVLAYQPAVAPNVVGVVVFGLSFLIQLAFGIRWRTWSYLVAMGVGTAFETIGYTGRLMLYHNPFSSSGLKIELVCLTFAPAFLAAGIYLNLKHVVLVFGPQYSRLRPQLYTWIFICCDVVSIVVQAGGAGYSITNNANETVAIAIMQLGLSSQVFTLGLFGVLAIEYFIRERANKPFNSDGRKGWREAIDPSEVPQKTKLFKYFVSGLVVAFVTILTRCAYRIGEMSGGWRSYLMQDQWTFVGLDEVMVIIATIFLTAFHPGYCLPKKQGPRADAVELQRAGNA